MPWTVMVDAAGGRQWTSSWQGGHGRWWRATTTVTTTAKEAILPYQTMPLSAAAGMTTTRCHGCGVAGGQLTEEGGGWAGNRGRTTTSAIVVAVSVVDIAVIGIGHRRGRRLVGHCRGRLSCQHWPSLTSAMVAAVDKWDMWWGAYGKKGMHESNH